jgi:hypothetical protein
MNRSQLNKNQRERQEAQPGHSEKEMSMRNVGEDPSRNEFPSLRDSSKRSGDFHERSQGDFGNQGVPGQQGEISGEDNRAIVPAVMDNDSFNNKGSKKSQRANKQFENNLEYKKAFIANSNLPRTPP